MMSGPRRAQRDSTEGAAAVEFALVVSLLFLLVGGIIDFGFAFNAQVSLTHAAREGVRVEAIGSGNATQTATNAFSAPAVTGFNASVVESCSGPSPDKARLRTRATYNFFVLPFGSRALTSEGVMRCGG
jgi:Flp pilus assembly protein TadG